MLYKSGACAAIVLVKLKESLYKVGGRGNGFGDARDVQFRLIPRGKISQTKGLLKDYPPPRKKLVSR